MATQVKIKDKSTAGESLREFMLDLLTEEVTVREVIRSRVYQEVKDYNAKLGTTFHGLVRPEDAVHEGFGFKFSVPRRLDWEKQFDAAIKAFKEDRVLILVDDQQVTSLEDEIVLTPDIEVTFLKLMPLVGG